MLLSICCDSEISDVEKLFQHFPEHKFRRLGCTHSQEGCWKASTKANPMQNINGKSYRQLGGGWTEGGECC